MVSASAPSIGYDEFGTWFDEFRTSTLEPGLALALASLERELADALNDRDLARIRNIAGRVKSKRRVWRKLSQPHYFGQIARVEDIPAVIDDLIGMRITCTNLRDLEMVQVALDNLPRNPRADHPLVLDQATERDYVETPKESGYRGWHVNLGVSVNGTPVTCELQVRTLLQDSWGELTHEDSYSKDKELPPLVEVLSKRMADLLATLDDIAEDLRSEVDRIEESLVAEPAADSGAARSPIADEEPDDDQLASGLGADAAQLLLERWQSLDRPIELASLAWALQQEFGADVSDDWFGHRGFKRFLRHAVPDGEISTGRKAYLLPPPTGTTAQPAPSDETTDDEEQDASDIPAEAQELRRVDRGFPLIEPAQWRQIFDQLADAWRRIGGGRPNISTINRLTRSARDRAGAGGEPLSRRHLDYVAKAVLATNESGEPLTSDQLGEMFIASTLQRMIDLRILGDRDAARRTAVVNWLSGRP